MRIGYGRVSTRDQNPDAQHDALTAASCEQIFTDKAPGTLARRPELDKALLVACRRGDQLVITKLDRLGRSLEHLIQLSRELERRGVDLVVLDQGIDTSTAAGRMFFHILGAIAEFEHALMIERTLDAGPCPVAETRAQPGPRPVRPGPDSMRRAHRNPAPCGSSWNALAERLPECPAGLVPGQPDVPGGPVPDPRMRNRPLPCAPRVVVPALTDAGRTAENAPLSVISPALSLEARRHRPMGSSRLALTCPVPPKLPRRSSRWLVTQLARWSLGSGFDDQAASARPTAHVGRLVIPARGGIL